MKTLLTIETTTPPLILDVKHMGNKQYLQLPQEYVGSYALVIFSFEDIKTELKGNTHYYTTSNFYILQDKEVKQHNTHGIIYVPKSYAGLTAYIFIHK